jgi:hypothetical protein
MAALVAVLVGRHWETHKGALCHTADHRMRLRVHPQHRLQQQAAPAPIADGTQARHAGMRGEVERGGILDQEDDRSSSQVGARLLPVRTHQRFKGHVRIIEQAIQGFDRSPGLLLLRQRGGRITSYALGRRDGSPSAPLISQLHLAKRLFCPASWVQQGHCIHTPFYQTVKCG